MSDSPDLKNLAICLIADDEAILASVRIACPPPHGLSLFSLDGLVDHHNTLSVHGNSVVNSAKAADAIMIGWNPALAPVINTVAYHVHKTSMSPVIALCNGDPDDQVSALAAGVDLTLTFPLHLPLIQLKIAAYRRSANLAYLKGVRYGGQKRDEIDVNLEQRKIQQFGKIRLDSRSRSFYIDSTSIPLTPREFALLSYLVENAGTACSRHEILDAVWGITFDTGTNMVDVYMYFLRKKLDAYGLKGMIETVRSLGYRLSLDVPTSDFN